MSDERSIEKFTVDTFLILRHFTIVNGIVLIILMFIPLNVAMKFYIILLISVYYLGFLLFTGVPLTIMINQREGTLTIISFRLFLRKNESYDYKELDCTYQKEVGARGAKIMMLKLVDREGKILLQIMPNFNGWSNEKLLMIYKDLTN